MYAKHEYTTKRQRQPPSIAHTEIDFIIKQTKIISVIIVFFIFSTFLCGGKFESGWRCSPMATICNRLKTSEISCVKPSLGTTYVYNFATTTKNFACEQ